MNNPSWEDWLGVPFGGAGLALAGTADKANGGGVLGGVANTLEGNPNAAASQIQKLMQLAFSQGKGINQTLQQEKANSMKYFQPMQQMFGNMYGTGGLMPAKAPGAPGGGSAY